MTEKCLFGVRNNCDCPLDGDYGIACAMQAGDDTCDEKFGPVQTADNSMLDSENLSYVKAEEQSFVPDYMAGEMSMDMLNCDGVISLDQLTGQGVLAEFLGMINVPDELSAKLVACRFQMRRLSY